MASHPVKILIVEDDNLIAKDLATDLREVGYVVTHIADNKDDALQSIKQEKPDLAIVDIELNIKGSRQKDTLGGIELVKTLTKNHNIPCLYYTGFGADQGIIDQANKSSHIGILLKSSPFLQVKVAIQSALKKFWEAEKKRTLPSFLFANGTLKIRQSERQFLAKIQIEDIDYIEYKDRTIYFHLETTQNIFEKKWISLSEFLQQFEHPSLIQISSKYIINIDKLDGFIKETDELILTTREGKKIFPISRTYSDDFRKYFSQYTIKSK